MKTPLKVSKHEIETEAEDHAEETRYAVTHHGRELHPEKASEAKAVKSGSRQDKPWQID
jgi:hypothetical protein